MSFLGYFGTPKTGYFGTRRRAKLPLADEGLTLDPLNFHSFDVLTLNICFLTQTMAKSTILHTIRKEILFLFEWSSIVNIIVTSKNKKRQKNKVSQNTPSSFPKEKKKTRQLKIHN